MKYDASDLGTLRAFPLIMQTEFSQTADFDEAAYVAFIDLIEAEASEPCIPCDAGPVDDTTLVIWSL